jgi:heme-degrading monooxygenase HmoA
MYGTVARLHMKPGTEEKLRRQLRQFEGAGVPGEIGEYVYRTDENPNEYYLAVIFRDREAYMANADSPEQDVRYRKLAKLFTDEPEWHDGEIVHVEYHDGTGVTAGRGGDGLDDEEPYWWSALA